MSSIRQNRTPLSNITTTYGQRTIPSNQRQTYGQENVSTSQRPIVPQVNVAQLIIPTSPVIEQVISRDPTYQRGAGFEFPDDYEDQVQGWIDSIPDPPQ